MSDILDIARERLRDEPPRTHWAGCESSHDACLVAKLAAEVNRYQQREQHFAKTLQVADGGQYRADWDSAVEGVVRERNEARAEVERLTAERDEARAEKERTVENAVGVLMGGCMKHGTSLSFQEFVDLGGGACPICLTADLAAARAEVERLRADPRLALTKRDWQSISAWAELAADNAWGVAEVREYEHIARVARAALEEGEGT